MHKHLHIVCFDVPYPVNYGGVFDLYWKVRALADLGIRIHLHCFQYGRGEQAELEKYCEEVHYYSRNEGHKGFSTTIPYIVASRSSEELIQNLQKDDFPILLEGIHCTYPLFARKLEGRKIIIRLANVEYEYYHHLFIHERSLLKKAYYYNESRLLKCYEQCIANRATILALSPKDVKTYQQKFGAKDISYLPVFVPFKEVQSEEGLGTYCLYHGNLSIAENEKAAIWMMDKVFNNLKIPFVIAGKDPSSRLKRMVESHCQVCLVANPAEEEMNDLIRKAQIHLVPSFNDTGMKLKLLNALYNGRHCIVNEATVMETGLESACHVASSPEAFKEIIIQLYRHPFAEEEIRLRKKILLKTFNNQANALTLERAIWS